MRASLVPTHTARPNHATPNAPAGLMKRYPATIGVAAMLLIVSIIWFAIWLVAALGVSLNTDYGISLKYLIFVFFLFVHYWVTQVLKASVRSCCVPTNPPPPCRPNSQGAPAEGWSPRLGCHA